jgi:hypothetical protein
MEFPLILMNGKRLKVRRLFGQGLSKDSRHHLNSTLMLILARYDYALTGHAGLDME